MKVSVLICCYNQVQTIRRAIDSVLWQKTNFPVQIIVCDDGSRDGTRDIIKEYYDKNLLSCIEFPQHLGMMKNYAQGFKRCTGKYICFADGDDWWFSDNKLQRQADFMDANPNVGLCVTDVMIQRGDNLECSAQDGVITFDTLLKGTAGIYAQSYMLRRDVFERHVHFDDFVERGFTVWDLPIVLELIRHRSIVRLNFYSAVFNVLDESVTHTRSRVKRFRYVMGNYRIRWHYIRKYGCKAGTVLYLIYRLTRDIISIILKRW